MKVLDVRALNDGVDQTVMKINTFQTQVNKLQKSVHDIISLDGSLEGKGGNAIRAFYAEYHAPFLDFLYEFIDAYENTLKQIKQAVLSFERAENGLIQESFLENDIKQGLQKIENGTQELVNRVNQAIRGIQDIVSLPYLHDGKLVDNVRHGKKKITETITQLHALDRTQTSALQPVEQDLTTMNNYINQIRSLTKSEHMSLQNFNSHAWRDDNAYKAILDGVTTEVGESNTSLNSDVEHSKRPNLDITLDITAPFSTPGNAVSRVTEAAAFYNVSRDVKQGLAINRYRTEGTRTIKYRVSNPERLNISKPKPGRSTKIFDKTYIDKELKRGNTPKIAKHVRPGSGALHAVKSRAGWLGVALGTGHNIYQNIQSGESASKVVGDAGIDVGLGAISLATGGVIAAAVVGTLGAPILVGAIAGIGLSIGISYLLDGLKFDGKTVSERIKGGVQTIAGWFKK